MNLQSSLDADGKKSAFWTNKCAAPELSPCNGLYATDSGPSRDAVMLSLDVGGTVMIVHLCVYSCHQGDHNV